MIRWSLKRWIGVCLLGTLLGSAGCDGGVLGPYRSKCAPCSCEQKPAGTKVAVKAAPCRYTAPAGCATVGAGTCRCCKCGGVTTRIVSAKAAPCKPCPTCVPHPAARQGTLGPPELADAPPPRQRPAKLPNPDRAVEQIDYRFTQEAGHVRRAYVDLTVQPWFDCAENHSWLKGQVLYDAGTNTWRLHYASVDDADPYGGTVTLTGGDKLKPLKDGQAVRVQGKLLDPDRREPESPYEVSSFEILEIH